MSEVTVLELILGGLFGCFLGVAITLAVVALIRGREIAAIERAGIWRVGPRAYRLGRLDNEGVEEIIRRNKQAEVSEPVVKMPPLRGSVG